MFDSNFFSKKQVEKFLIATCGKGVRRDKATMEYIRKMARNVESAYEIGLRDGENGTELVDKAQLYSDSSALSELAMSAIDFAYSAYSTGHLVGSAKRGDCG